MARFALSSSDQYSRVPTLFFAFACIAGQPPRRYLALKFSQRPKTADQLFTLVRYTPKILTPAPTMTGDGAAVSQHSHEQPCHRLNRLKSMVAPWVALSEVLGEETISEIAGSTQASWSKQRVTVSERQATTDVPIQQAEMVDDWHFSARTAAILTSGWQDSVGPLQPMVPTIDRRSDTYTRIADDLPSRQCHQRL